MLRQVAAQNDEQVTVLVAAPESMSERFNDFGSLVTQSWLEQNIVLSDEQIQITDRPADQASVAATYLTQLNEEFSADQMTIGVPDASVIPQLERSLNAVGVGHRSLAGRPLSETSPVRLMIACREYLRKQDYATFAALVRHPDLFEWIAETSESDSFISELDAYQNNFLPGRIRLAETQPFGDPDKVQGDIDPYDDKSVGRAKRNAEATRLLNRVHEQVCELLAPLDGEPGHITKWTRPWSEVLVKVYGHRDMDREDLKDRQIIMACEAIYQALGTQQQIPTEFATRTSAIQALDWAVDAASETRVVPPPSSDAVELAGWLDLAMDDAPVLVITGMNDEHVPSSEVGHQFLPNSLCESLGILDNNRRFARDAYALTVMASVRKHLQLISGRRDDEGEPKKPSRLLFADEPRVAAIRARAFFGYKGKAEARFWLAPQPDEEFEQQFFVPPPVCTEAIDSLTVTSFKEFLRCPYRFYLQKILKLRDLADDWRELSGGTFGDLAHNVLEAFGRGEAKDETRPGSIQEFLSEQLEVEVKKRFSGSRLPAVKIQIEQLRRRLRQFSEFQAKRRKDGWAIVSTEEMLHYQFMVDNLPFTIRGKIDRVDQHEGTQRVAVWDYKTSDKGELPGPAHHTRNGWKDLQLPLYRYLVQEVEAVRNADFSNVQMGYVMLPRKLEEVGFQLTDWDEATLASADNTTADIIRKLRAGQFWPPVLKPPVYSEAFAAICQDHVFERLSWESVS